MKKPALRALIPPGAILVMTVLVLAGCTPRPRLVLLEEFEAAPAVLDTLDAELALRPGCEFRTIPRDSLPESATAVLGAVDGDDGPGIFAATPTPAPETLITCNLELKLGYSSGYSTPGFTTSSGVTVPGTYFGGYSSGGWQHQDSRTVPVEIVHDVDPYLLCRVSGRIGLGWTFLTEKHVYVRKPGLELLVEESRVPPHAGSVPMEGGSWILVEKPWVEHFVVESKVAEKPAKAEEILDLPDEPEEDRREPMTCENFESILAEYPDHPEPFSAIIRATCLASAGRDEEALKQMRHAIDEVRNDRSFSFAIQDFYWQELLFLVAGGRIEQAVRTGAAYLHASRASDDIPWTFEEEAKVETSPHAEFLRNRGGDIERHWPEFRQAFALALEEAGREAETAAVRAAAEAAAAAAESAPPAETPDHSSLGGAGGG